MPFEFFYTPELVGGRFQSTSSKDSIVRACVGKSEMWRQFRQVECSTRPGAGIHQSGDGSLAAGMLHGSGNVRATHRQRPTCSEKGQDRPLAGDWIRTSPEYAVPPRIKLDPTLPARSPLRYDAGMHAFEATFPAGPIGLQGVAMPGQALFAELLRDAAAWLQPTLIQVANAIAPTVEKWGSRLARCPVAAGSIAR